MQSQYWISGIWGSLLNLPWGIEKFCLFSIFIWNLFGLQVNFFSFHNLSPNAGQLEGSSCIAILVSCEVILKQYCFCLFTKIHLDFGSTSILIIEFSMNMLFPMK